jgi:hypothetical protein
LIADLVKSLSQTSDQPFALVARDKLR